MMNQVKIPINQKYSLSISELSIYLGIGEHSLRKFITQNTEITDCLIYVGSTVRVKREKFINYLDRNQIKM